jgi:hypothetical protein
MRISSRPMDERRRGISSQAFSRNDELLARRNQMDELITLEIFTDYV